MEQYVYLGCFLFGLLFTIVSVFFGHHFGGGSDAHFDLGTGGHAEAGYEHSGMPGISPFSPTTICAFITAFGGFGLIFSRISATKSVWVSTPLSLFGGLLISAAVLALFSYVFQRTQSSSEGRIGSLVGHTATVITPIPISGVGEIAYVQGGSRYTAPAREQNGVAVANGQTVKITRIAESQFFVSAL
jgi:membrane protein implicated in regulation of membrane protease activity